MKKLASKGTNIMALAVLSAIWLCLNLSSIVSRGQAYQAVQEVSKKYGSDLERDFVFDKVESRSGFPGITLTYKGYNQKSGEVAIIQIQRFLMFGWQECKFERGLLE